MNIFFIFVLASFLAFASFALFILLYMNITIIIYIFIQIKLFKFEVYFSNLHNLICLYRWNIFTLVIDNYIRTIILFIKSRYKIDIFFLFT